MGTRTEHLRAHHPRPTESEIPAMPSGRLCRRTGYDGRVRAIADVAELGSPTDSRAAEMRATERPSP